MSWLLLAASLATEEGEASPENGFLFPVPAAVGGHALVSLWPMEGSSVQWVHWGTGILLLFIAQSAILLRVKAVVEFNIITLTVHIVATKKIKAFSPSRPQSAELLFPRRISGASSTHWELLPSHATSSPAMNLLAFALLGWRNCSKDQADTLLPWSHS